MSYTICYISNATDHLLEDELMQLFEKVTILNNSKNINGILLSNFGHFFQILEGEKKIVEDLFNNQIKKDPRHTDIFIIIEKEYPKAIFNEYSSKFNTVKNSEDLKNVIAYLDKNKFNSTNEKLKRLLDPFMLSMED